jgi:Short C-terminal domain
VDGGHVAKSKTGAVVAFGVLGLGAKITKNEACLSVHLNDGGAVKFKVDKMTPQQLHAKFSVLLASRGVHVGDEPASAAATPVADELAKFAALRDQGILTEDEFAAKKPQLLT